MGDPLGNHCGAGRRPARLGSAGASPAPQEIAQRSEPAVCSGSCLLQHSRAARIVQNTLLHFEGRRYHLGGWCVMPNHVHVVVAPLEPHPLAGILHSWKSFSAHAINKLFGRTGALWERESFDHLIRRAEDLERFIAYTHANPVEAGLCREPQAWPWSSCGADFEPAAVAFTDPRATAFVPPRRRGELPHLHKEGGIYFITFRLRDAVMPARGTGPNHKGQSAGW